MTEDYSSEDVPLGSYAVLMGSYAAVFGGLYFLSTKLRDKPQPPRGADLALIAVASYKLSRVVTMSFIGAPIRAPFTERGESLKGGEIQDESRGHGLQKAVGNLLTCPFCFNVWATTAFSFGYRFAPRVTLQAAEILTIAAIGDVLHFGFRNMREKST